MFVLLRLLRRKQAGILSPEAAHLVKTYDYDPDQAKETMGQGRSCSLAQELEPIMPPEAHLLEAIVEDFRDDSSQEWTAHFQTRVRVHFNEVEFEIFIDHEIVTEKLWEQIIQNI